MSNQETISNAVSPVSCISEDFNSSESSIAAFPTLNQPVMDTTLLEGNTCVSGQLYMSGPFIFDSPI